MKLEAGDSVFKSHIIPFEVYETSYPGQGFLVK